MEVEINGEKHILKEISYLDGIDIEETRQKEGLRASIKKLMILSGISEKDVDSLRPLEGNEVLKAINKLNNLSSDFQNPAESNKS